MTAQRGQLLRQWFEAACDLPAEKWESFLRAQCDDESLCDDVLDLLLRDQRQAHGASDSPGKLLDQPLLSADQAQRLSSFSTEAPIPESIGEYQVVRLIGRGSMGTVYEAIQPGTGTRVALKVLRAGIPSEDLLQRFHREAEALARLDHPAIARIFEAGSARMGPGAYPFIAMEYVEGLALDDYCQQHQLDGRARLALMSRVAAGVSHAHQRGIIHRDLKPSNVLVDTMGQPRLLDFGVARNTVDSTLNGDSGLRTATGQLVGTLQYMSPEQTLGNPRDVGVPSDVYALGVLGYEMLAERLPYTVSDCPLDEALRRIQLEDGPLLGALNKSFSGDIEAIFTKALEKDPQRRYGSVEDLARDMDAALAQQPVSAPRPKALDPLRRFAKRNPKTVGAAAAFILLAALGIGGTSWGWLEASAQSDRVSALLVQQQELTEQADAARQDMALAYSESEVVVQFLEDMFAALGDRAQGQQVLLQDVLTLAEPRIAANFVDQPRVAARLHRTFGLAYQAIANYDRALSHYDDLLTMAGGDGSPDAAFDTRNNLGDMTLLTRLSRAEIFVARGHYDQAIAALLDLRKRLPPTNLTLAALTAQRLVHAYNLAGDGAGARHELDRLLTEQTPLPGDSPLLDENLRIELAVSEALNGSGEQPAADLEAIWKTRQERLGNEHVDTIIVAQSLAELLVRQGRYDEAEPLLRHVIEVRHTVSGAEHPQTLYATGRLAYLLEESSRYPQALEILDQLVPTSRRILGPEHPHTVSMVCTLSAAAVQSGRADGHQLIEEALALGRRTLRADHPHMLTLLSNAGAVQGQLQNYEAAATLLREAVTLCDDLESTKAIDRVLVMVNLSGVLMALQKIDEAEELIRATLPLAREILGAGHPQEASLVAYLGDIAVGAKRWEEAEQHYLTLIGYDLGSTHISSLIATTGLGIVFTHTGRAEQGEALLRATREMVLKTYGPNTDLAIRCDEALADVQELRVSGGANDSL